MSQGSNLGRAAANAAGAFGEAYHDVLKEQRAEQEHRDAMRFHLADAQRKDKMGQFSLAASATHQGRMEAIAAQNAADKRLALEVQLQGLANRGKSGSQIKTPEIHTENRAKELIATGMKPETAYAKAAAETLRLSHPIERISDMGPTSANLKQGALDADTQAKLDAAWAKEKYSPKALSDPTYEDTFKRNWLASLPTTKVGKNTPETPAATKGDFSHLWTK